MSLAEVVAVDAASPPSSLSLFALCIRVSESSKGPANCLQLQLLDGPTLLEAKILPSHKPRALDCSVAEYVAAVERALSPLEKDETPRFEFRWSREEQTLTLMERAGFAMKFSSIKFQRSDDDRFSMLLHLVAEQQRKKLLFIRCTEEKVKKLESLLQQKEMLLESALNQKQKSEDTLFQRFCAVLNAKKNEIKRLQNELERAQEVQSYDTTSIAKKKIPVGKRSRKTTGAKLKKMEREVNDEDEDMSNGSSKESEDERTMTEGEEDDEGLNKRTKRDAISAYSQVPALRSSVKISSAEDLLSSMDDIIKNEEETDEAVLRGTRSPDVKSEPVASQLQTQAVGSAKTRSCSRTKNSAFVKKAPSSPTEEEPKQVKPPRPAAPVDEPMDSEEEDILDMLS